MGHVKCSPHGVMLAACVDDETWDSYSIIAVLSCHHFFRGNLFFPGSLKQGFSTNGLGTSTGLDVIEKKKVKVTVTFKNGCFYFFNHVSLHFILKWSLLSVPLFRT